MRPVSHCNTMRTFPRLRAFREFVEVILKTVFFISAGVAGDPPERRAERKSAVVTGTFWRPESTSLRALMKSCLSSSGRAPSLMKSFTSFLGPGLSKSRLPLVGRVLQVGKQGLGPVGHQAIQFIVQIVQFRAHVSGVRFCTRLVAAVGADGRGVHLLFNQCEATL